MQPVTLTTGRLVLSVPTEADVDAIFTACQDPTLQRYTTVPSPYERQHAVGFIEHATTRWRDDLEATWAIREGGALVGMIGLNGITPAGAGEIGYWMAAPHRGRGLITEAARAVVDWGLGADGAALARMEWRAVAGNTGSASVARKLGFRYEGLLRRAAANSFGRDDAWIAGLLPSDDRMPQPWSVLEN